MISLYRLRNFVDFAEYIRCFVFRESGLWKLRFRKFMMRRAIGKWLD